MNAFSTITLAIAGTHPVLLDGIKSIFANHMCGIQVLIVAYNGKDLLDKIARAERKPDICIVDVDMPVLDGFDTVVQLKKKYPDIHGCAYTDNASDYAILAMLKNGASGYVLKTVYTAEFEQAMRDIKAKGFYYSKVVTEKFPKIAPGSMKKYLKKLLPPEHVKFLSLCCSAMTYSEIAKKMNISPRTAEHYAEKIGDKIGVRKRIELALYAQMAGIGKLHSNGKVGE